MITGFSRSTSLPNPKPYHVRSSSLPSRSHPLVSQLQQDLTSLRAWQSEPSTSSWLTNGLTKIQLLHVALDDLLRLQHTQDVLRRRRSSEKLLDDFLRFADAFGSFREALFSIHQLTCSSQAAARRRDEAKLGSNARALKKVEKEVVRVVSSLREVGKSPNPVSSNVGEAELVGILREVKVVFASASVALFSAVLGLLPEAFGCFTSSSDSSWAVLRRRLTSTRGSKRKEEEWERSLERLKGLERRMFGVESGCERVFRCLINTRVSLLNLLTP